MLQSLFRSWRLLTSMACTLLLVACASSGPSQHEVAGTSSAKVSQDAALGTQWGEELSSSVSTVHLKRISNTPADIVEIHYAANQVRGSSIQNANIADGRIQLSILNERGGKSALTQEGQYLYLKGRKGERYQLHYRNLSANTYEIVATVDGLDVLNGQPGSIRNSGYVLRPNSTLVIEGFRLSQSEVAAFRFSSPDDAYVANTPAGDVRNVGVIGTAVFVLDVPVAEKNRKPVGGENAFPADNNGYAPRPRYSY